MFDGRYGKALTVGLIVLILIVVGTLTFFAVDYVKNSNMKNDASNAVDRFEGSVNKEENNTGNNTQNNADNNNEQVNDNVELNIQTENVTIDTNVDDSEISGNTYKGFPVVGTIQIPKIDLKYPVLKEGTADAIEVSVAINVGPGLNKIGNTVIIGHNYRNGTFFSNNKNLANGDEIFITDETGTKVKYIIYNIYTTTPEDSDYMDREVGEIREVTLVTCTDDTKSRLIICAKEA